MQHDALNRFSASPAGSLYLVHRPGIAQPAALIGGNTEQLKEAVKAGDEAVVFSIILEIDAAIGLL